MTFKNHNRYHKSRKKGHTYDPDVPASILVSVEYSKTIYDLIHSVIFYPMTSLESRHSDGGDLSIGG